MQFGIHIYNFFVKIYVGFVADIDIKILGVPPLGARHAFPRLEYEMDGWMDGSRDEKSFTKNDHNILYYM
jgi:hypothetical protein